jgi:hypothetical protein
MLTYKSNEAIKFLQALVIACSIMVISTGAAFAASVDDKQKEVDQIIFEQHNGDFTEQGFTVTHTAPVNNKVEVGITPYTEASAAYLYDILGEDKVEIVEGVQSVTLDSPVISEPVVTKTTIVDNDAKTIAYQEPATSSNSKLIWMGSIIAALIIVGGILLGLRKRQATSKTH